MNPQHRDRVAFMRLCSGRFRRGMKLTQVQTGKTIAVHSPIFFFAQSRELADEAFPGDRSEEHTSELQSLMRISYAVFCLKKKTKPTQHIPSCICQINSILHSDTNN